MDIEKVIDRNFTKITNDYHKFALLKDKCRKCSIYHDYKQVGMSEGNAKDPLFMFIGEGPRQDEVVQNRPFVGLAGQILKTELRKYPKVFRRDTMIITNVLACRPKNNKFPAGDNNPRVQTCTSSWLFREIELLKPKVIVTLGNPALKTVRGDWDITANRGKWKFLNKFQAWSFATFHPSYVMRNKNEGKQFIVDQFVSDIENVSKMWKTMIGDFRLSINKDQQARVVAIQKVIDMGLLGQ